MQIDINDNGLNCTELHDKRDLPANNDLYLNVG